MKRHFLKIQGTLDFQNNTNNTHETGKVCTGMHWQIA